MLESVRQGELIQVRRGVYAHADQLSACMIDIEAVVPEGILCLWSAWNIATSISCSNKKRPEDNSPRISSGEVAPLYCIYP